MGFPLHKPHILLIRVGASNLGTREWWFQTEPPFPGADSQVNHVKLQGGYHVCSSFLERSKQEMND